jgi:hypothetical protein
MTSTAFTLPGTGSQQENGNAMWSNTTAIQAADGSYATASLVSSQDTWDLTATNFGFSIPVGATINGITVQVVGNTDRTFDGSPNPFNYITVSLWDSSAAIGAPKFDTSVLNDNIITFGSSSDKWGVALTRAMVVGSGFGLSIYASCDGPGDVEPINLNIDYVKMSVTYSTGPTPGQKMSMLMGGK